MSEYAERDPEKLEPHYSKHVGAMTSEGLHSKTDIAAELAFRDSNIDGLLETLDAKFDEIEQWKNAAKVMAALYGRNVKWDGGSWFRDNIEISLDEELPAESIEDLLQIAWKANKDGVTAALSQTTKDCGCYECSNDERRMTTMITCIYCGNKRCPKASNHIYDCTDSNEPGQPGSRYVSDKICRCCGSDRPPELENERLTCKQCGHVAGEESLTDWKHPMTLRECMEAEEGQCSHPNTAAASAINTASVWCPDCEQWVQLETEKGNG